MLPDLIRTRPAVNWLLGLMLASLGALALWWATDPRPGSAGKAAGLVLVAAAMGGCWAVWSRWPRTTPVAVALFAALAVAAVAVGNNPLSLLAAAVAGLVAVLQFGRWAAVALGLAVSLVGLAGHLALGSSAETIVAETVGMGLMLAVVIAVAELVRAAETAVRERDAALAEAVRTNALLRDRLAGAQEAVLADERARTARALHDGLGHRLTAVGLSLEYSQRVREQRPEAAWDEVGRARTEVAGALADMRRLVRAQHPVDLRATLGPEALHALADSFAAAGLDVRVDVGDLPELPERQHLLAIRFLQEGLTNVVRHSDAGAVRLGVAATADGLRMRLSDDGAHPGPVVEGFGLRSLRERAVELGGTLEVDAAPGGLTLTLALPREEAPCVS